MGGITDPPIGVLERYGHHVKFPESSFRFRYRVRILRLPRTNRKLDGIS